MNAVDALERLTAPMRLAFDEAWTSWRSGNFGIGAVLVDPSDMTVVATGRNRVGQLDREPGLLSGNMTAHAEMNAFAAMDRFNAEGLHLYTTLQPCLMCSATAMQLKVAHVHFAAADEFYDDLDAAWNASEVTRARMPQVTGPLDGELVRLAQFARLLPMAYTLEHFPGRTAEQLARERNVGLAELLDQLRRDGSLGEIRQVAELVDGLAMLWDRLSG